MVVLNNCNNHSYIYLCRKYAGICVVILAHLMSSSRTAQAQVVRGAVELPSGAKAMAPHMTAGPDGTVYLSWVERGEGMASLHMARRDGAAWVDVEQIASGSDWFVNWADVPTITVGADGAMLATWLQRLGEGRYAYGVRQAVRQADGAWTAPEWLHEDVSETEHGFVSAEWTGTDFLVTWLDGAGYGAGRGEMEVHARTVSPAGATGPEHVLDSRACDCCPTAMTRTADGRVVSAWRDRSEGEIRDIVVATRSADGSWSEPKVQHDDGWLIQACPVNGPALDAFGNDIGLVWFTAAGDAPAVWARINDGPPVRVDAGRPSGRVAARMLSPTELAVVWLEDGLWMRIIGTGGPSGGSASEPVRLADASSARSTGYPVMERLGDDRLLVVWTGNGLSAVEVDVP